VRLVVRQSLGQVVNHRHLVLVYQNSSPHSLLPRALGEAEVVVPRHRPTPLADLLVLKVPEEAKAVAPQSLLVPKARARSDSIRLVRKVVSQFVQRWI
jgi:hypothetical protein